jgi:hypothetical protein
MDTTPMDTTPMDTTPMDTTPAGADPGDAAQPKHGPELTFEELRVLGSLVEKELTTPEQYPLTLNALVPRVQPEVQPRAGARPRRVHRLGCGDELEDERTCPVRPPFARALGPCDMRT